MPKITWDNTGEHFYETGVDHGVLYTLNSSGEYTNGVAWNGLSTITESPSGADANDVYADNIKYISIRSAEDFGATIEAYTYPDEFLACDGSAELAPGITIGQQSRNTFGLSYRTIVGNDIQNNDYGYKLHLVYGATASPSEKSYESVNDSPEPAAMSWEITTTPVTVDGYKATSQLIIDSTKVDKEILSALETILYGSDTEAARLPLPNEVMELIAAASE